MNNQRFKFGRRKSDLILPFTLFVIALAATLWAQRTHMAMQEVQQQNQVLQTQVHLLERLLKQIEKPKDPLPQRGH